MILLIFLSVLIIYLFYEFYWKRRIYPPGPIPLPLLGNGLSIYMDSPGYEIFRKWKNEYGPVFTMWMSFQPVVVIADYELIKETIIKDGDKFADRWVPEEFMRLMRGGIYGIISTKGDLWREQRRFVLHTLRDFGMGRNLMEERIMIEVDYMLERLSKLRTGIKMQKEFDTAIGSIINNIVFGYRFDEENQHEFRIVKTALRKLLNDLTNPLFLVAAFVPMSRGLPGIKGKYEAVLANNRTIFEFIESQIEARKREIDLKTEGYDDFVECYLKEKAKKMGTPQEDFYCDKQLVNTLLDIWLGGLDSTSNTLTWAICYILNYPEVQDRLHEELDRVIKSDRKITSADKNQLPYVNAVVSEVLRATNLVPQNLQRVLSEEMLIGGYKVPKGTPILPQIATVMLDERVFPDPYRFDPSRFMNLDGSLRTYPELVPFSIGKRQCVGEGLARMELYLFISNLFQRFKITANQLPSMEKTFGQTMAAKEYECNFEDRHRFA